MALRSNFQEMLGGTSRLYVCRLSKKYVSNFSGIDLNIKCYFGTDKGVNMELSVHLAWNTQLNIGGKSAL
jgi:hypothetical protein